MNMKIDVTVAEKVLATVRQGLVGGLGSPEPGKMCVEAAVCFALGLPHNDDPQCVAQSLRAFKIRLNDSAWSSTSARAKGLERLAVAQLGSIENFDEVDFAKRISDKAKEWADEAKKIADAMTLGSTWAASAANSAANSAAYSAYSAAYSANSAANSAAYSAASAADSAAAAAAYSAASADSAASAAAAAASAAISAAAAAARDAFLSKCAEDCVQVLIAMNAPGVQWLSLTEAPA